MLYWFKNNNKVANKQHLNNNINNNKEDIAIVDDFIIFNGLNSFFIGNLKIK